MRFSHLIQSITAIVLTVCLCAGLVPPGITLPVFTRSGALAESEDAWLYRIGADGYAEVLGYRDASVSTLSIPAALGGAWVTGYILKMANCLAPLLFERVIFSASRRCPRKAR